MKKVMFVATVVQKHINVFHLPYLKMFKEKSWDTLVCAKNDFAKESECQIPYCDTYYDIEFSRNPFSLKNYSSYKALKKIIADEKPDIIHCHTPVAGILSRLAAISARKKGTKVVYTAHGFHFFKGAPLKNWLIYFPAEWLCSFFTDTIITINEEDYNLAKKHLHPKNCEYVNGVGVDIERISTLKIDRDKKRRELELSAEDIAVLSVGELTNRKNHKVILEALKKLNNSKIHYYIVGNGALKTELEKKAKEFHIEKQVHFMGFRYDVFELCIASDIFCFPSLQEGLPVSVMEAMASGLPVICSNIRGNKDLIENEKGGFLYAPDDCDSFADGIGRLARDKSTRESFGEYNMIKIKEYSLDSVMKKMTKIYDDLEI